MRADFRLQRRVERGQIRDGERVFIVLTRATHVRASEDVDNDVAVWS
jgi:hypothetical protein